MLILRAARLAKGLGSDEIAERVGYHRTHVLDVEAGSLPVTKRFRERFAQAFGQEAADKLLQPFDLSAFGLPDLSPQDGGSSN